MELRSAIGQPRRLNPSWHIGVARRLHAPSRPPLHDAIGFPRGAESGGGMGLMWLFGDEFQEPVRGVEGVV
jgi:hypothetical protein